MKIRIQDYINLGERLGHSCVVSLVVACLMCCMCPSMLQAQEWADFDGSFSVGEGLVTSASQLDCNHIEPTEGSLAALLDGNFSTFFHSTWSQPNPDGKYAYLQVDLGAQFKQVGITYAKRSTNNSGNPTKVRVYATNNPSGTWYDQGYIQCTYEYASMIGVFSVAGYSGCELITFKSPYRHMRLEVQETEGGGYGNGNLYFYWSEFRAYDPTKKSNLSTDMSKLVVNEVQTANIDMTLGPTWNYDGWVEFHNPDTVDIVMKKCFLSDDEAEPKKYPLSGTVKVKAGGYGLLWFGSHEDNPSGQVQCKLEPDGGTFYLFDSEGNVVHTINYPEAKARTSWALHADGKNQWGYTSHPTPGAANVEKGFAQEMLSAPVVDKETTLYSGTLDCTVAIPQGCTLRYTIDGSTPTDTHGVISQTGKFHLSNTTRIFRFRLFKSGMLPSPVVTRSYICTTNKYTLPVVSVVTDPDHLYDDSIGVMVQGVNGVSGRGQGACNWNRDWDRPVNFEFILPDGKVAANQETNLIICGGWSRANTPHSFKIKANKIYYGNNTLDYPFFSEKPFLKHKTLQFRSGGNDNYCRFMDPALQTIIRTSGIDVDGQAYQPVVHYLNGVYKGVINMREPNNKHFVYANYGWDEDEIDQFEIGTARYNQVCGTKDALNELTELSRNCASDNVYEKVCKLLDINEYCNYIATEIYLGTTDWLNNNNNCKGFRLRAEGGRFRILTHDLDSSFGTTDAFDYFANPRNLYNYTSGRDEEFDIINIFINLCQNAKFRRQFTDTFCLVMGSVFEPSRCKEITDSLVKNVSEMMMIEGISPNGSANSIKNNLTTSRQTTMLAKMKNYSRLQLSSTTFHKIKLRSNLPEARLFVNELPVPTNRFDGSLRAFSTVRASAPAGYRFVGWKEGRSGNVSTLLPFGSQWVYYDKGSMDGRGWYSPGYSALLWKKGTAPLGYANKDLGIKTTISYGSDSSNKYPTAYFRNTLSVNDVSEWESVTMTYRCDDGFVAYVNGEEVGRFNMPSGNVSYSTFSTNYTGDWEEGELTLPISLFHEGENTIAVEVHNTSVTSSDLFWDATIEVSTKEGENSKVLSTGESYRIPYSCSLVACYEKVAPEDEGPTNLPVRINEVSAANSIYVNDYFKRNDWLELYNTTDSVIDLAGMYLSDDAAHPYKYRIPSYADLVGCPSTLIQPHDFRVVWCDKSEAKSELHTTFKLSADGGQVVLSSADQMWTDTLSYTKHNGNQTVGLYPDGGSKCRLLDDPTIAAANRFSSYDISLYERFIYPNSTGIDLIEEERDERLSDNSGEWYDLLGRKVKAPQRGQIYIVGGRKVLWK